MNCYCEFCCLVTISKVIILLVTERIYYYGEFCDAMADSLKTILYM